MVDPIDSLPLTDKRAAAALRERFIGKLDADCAELYDSGIREEYTAWSGIGAVHHVAGRILDVLHQTCAGSSDGFETAVMAVAVKLADLMVAHPRRRAVWAALRPVLDEMVQRHSSEWEAAIHASRLPRGRD
jgi:hypothetical protein